jgi:hypothetical protein
MLTDATLAGGALEDRQRRRPHSRAPGLDIKKWRRCTAEPKTRSVPVYYYKCVLMLSYKCPHKGGNGGDAAQSQRSEVYQYTTIYVSSCCHIRVLIQQEMAAMHRRAKDQKRISILLYMCPHAAIYVSSYRRKWRRCCAEPKTRSGPPSRY